jgi:UDP-galactose transporter B1
MCPDDVKQRNDSATTATIATTTTSALSSPLKMMMISDPLSISISKTFHQSEQRVNMDADDNFNVDENDNTASKSILLPEVAVSQTSSKPDRTSNHSSPNNTTTNTSTTLVLLRLAFCAVGICSCYICYGIFHEKLLRSGNEGGGGGGGGTDWQHQNTSPSTSQKNFMGPSFILFTQCITNVIVAMIWQQIQSSIQQQQKQKQPQKSSVSSASRTSDLPFRMLWITSLIYVTAMICSNEAIPHVSYPVAVLGKSCKLIPTMIIGQLISYSSKYFYRYTQQNDSSTLSNNTHREMFQQIAHTRNEWIAAICICIGIVTFHYQSPSFHNHSTPNDGNDDDDTITTKNPRLGIYLLCTSLFMDGLLSVCQNILKKSKPRSPNAVETMYYVNLYAVLFIGVFCYGTGQFHWLYTTTTFGNDSYSTYSSDLPNALTSLYSTMIHPYLSLIQNLCVLNIAAACGQIFIFLTITWFTPVITTMITTTRKFITILLSVLLYGHSFTMIQWSCIMFIFFGLYIAIIGTTKTSDSTTNTTKSNGTTSEQVSSNLQKKTN